MEVIKLRKWNELTEEVAAPTAVAVALSTGRPEMLKLAPKGPSSAEETAALYNIIRVLMDTNQELQNHSKSLADRMADLRRQLRGVGRKFDELFNLANFTDGDNAVDEDWPGGPR